MKLTNILKKPAVWALVIMACAAAAFVIQRRMAPLRVQTIKVERKAMALTVTGTAAGTVKSDMEVKITAQRAGRITSLRMEEGDRVRAGQVLAELDPVEAQLNVNLARSTLDRVRAQLAGARASYDAQSVQARAGMDAAEAALKEVTSRYENYKKLRDGGFISETEFGLRELEYKVAIANREAAEAQRESLRSVEADIKALEASVNEAESNLEIAELNMSYSYVKSPVDGVVVSRPVRFGETMMKGTLMGVVLTTGSLYVEVSIDEADVARVSEGQAARLTMDAYPGKVIKGKVYRISPVVLGSKLETRTFEVRVKVDEPGLVMKPGMSADVEIIIETVQAALVVPAQAVVEREGKKYVFAIEGGKARLRPVKLGASDWTEAEIASGVDEAAAVIVNPDLPGLEDGVRVKSGAK